MTGKETTDAGWYYSTPSGLTNNINGGLAFLKGVQAEEKEKIPVIRHKTYTPNKEEPD